MQQRFTALLLYWLVLLVQGCGQTGPLYMPEPPAPDAVQTPAAASGSNPATTD
ncbi:MAG: LPS translocon maturation chaperone LptM [Parahaliea sp.]